MAVFYVKALLLGVAVAAPVGPMSLLCMRRTLARGWALGMSTGLGIATGDGLYALVAALGLAGVSSFVLAHDRMLHLAAGLFLLYLGLRTFFTDDGKTAEPRTAVSSSWSAYATSVLLTLTNPPTIVMFAAAFAALAPRSGFLLSTALVTVAGVFSGSALWWLALTLTVAGVSRALGSSVRKRIDRVSGFALAALGGFEVRRAFTER